MELTLTQYLIICPLLFLAGFLDSIAGGGGLISLPALLIAGIPPHHALGTGKLAAFMGTGVATWRFAKNGYLNLKKAVWFIAAALVGSGIGSNLTLYVKEEIIEYMMLAVLPVVAFYVLRNRDLGENRRTADISPEKSFRIAFAAAFFIGAYDGFYGPGTGTFLILILTGAAGYTMQEAAGTTKAINLASNAAALVTFLLNGKTLILPGLIAGVCNIAGNYIGAGMVLTNGKKIVRPFVLVVLAILFIKILFG